MLLAALVMKEVNIAAAGAVDRELGGNIKKKHNIIVVFFQKRACKLQKKMKI